MGRRSVERERFWREAVAAWRRGGASVRAFCAGRGLNEHSFYCWRRELQRRDAQRDSRVDEGRSRADEGDARAERVRVRGRGGEGVLPRAIAPVSRGCSDSLPGFVALTVEDSVGAAAGDDRARDASPLLEVELAGGDRLRVPVGFDGSTLRTVIESLRSRPC
jgi:transposase-like protein